jgi:hypothetical protein
MLCIEHVQDRLWLSEPTDADLLSSVQRQLPTQTYLRHPYPAVSDVVQHNTIFPRPPRPPSRETIQLATATILQSAIRG